MSITLYKNAKGSTPIQEAAFGEYDDMINQENK
jgi:hypothetical protein